MSRYSIDTSELDKEVNRLKKQGFIPNTGDPAAMGMGMPMPAGGGMPIDPAVMGGAMPMGPAPAPMPPGPEGPVDLETIRRVVAEAVSEALADGKDGKKSEGSSAQSSDLTARLDQIEQKIDALADVIASLLGPMSPPQSLPSVSSDQAAMMGTQTPQLASPPGSPAGSNALLRVVQDLANQGRQ